MRLFGWIKHAYQRIKKGYSYRDLWSIDYWFLTVVPNMLEDFSNIKYLGIPGYLVVKAEEEHPEMSPDERDEWAINQWRCTCRQIAHHLREGHEPKEQVNEYSNEYWGWDDPNKNFGLQTDGKEWTFTTNPDKELEEKYDKRELEIEKYRQEELKKGMEMFAENLEKLWW